MLPSSTTIAASAPQMARLLFWHAADVSLSSKKVSGSSNAFVPSTQDVHRVPRLGFTVCVN